MKSINNSHAVTPAIARPPPLVSVIMVNFNGGWLLTEAVRAVLETIIPLEVIIVDNGSQDNSFAYLKRVVGEDVRVHLIENGLNLGFARANNIALRRARGDYVLLLNPDCIVRPNTLPCLLESMANHPQVGMAGCLIRNPDGTEQAGCRRAVPTPWRTFVRVLHLNRIFPHHPRFRSFLLLHQSLPQQAIEVEAISGAFMLIRREVLKHVGWLDENYFLHCEDLDWCMRFRQAGWKILFVPDVDAIHYKGVCSRDKPLQVLWYKHKGMARFYQKFFRHQYPRSLMVLVLSSVWGRFSLLALYAVSQKFKMGYKKRKSIGFQQDTCEASVEGKITDSSRPFKREELASPAVSSGATKRAREG